MSAASGRTLPLSLPRRLIGDLLHFAQKVPSVPVQRLMNLAPLAEARSRATPRISWYTLFVKAYGLVACQIPQLRRAYVPFPYARLYEHPCSVASVAMERIFRGEPAVFFAYVRHPENRTLPALEEYLRPYKVAPVETFGRYRKMLRLSRLPLPLRRLLWWTSLNTSGAKRARRMGTFGVSVYSGLGAESLHPLSPLTTTLHYGVIQADGTVTVRLTYDHRVMDGATVAQALSLLNETLLTTILEELRDDSAATSFEDSG
jgi:hypothetical protein